MKHWLERVHETVGIIQYRRYGLIETYAKKTNIHHFKNAHSISVYNESLERWVSPFWDTHDENIDFSTFEGSMPTMAGLVRYALDTGCVGQ